MTEKPGKEKKESIREAIAAMQQRQPVASAKSNSHQASEKQGEVAAKEKARAVVAAAKKSSMDGSKCFGDGPQWNQQGEGNSYESRKQEDGEKGDQSIAGPIKRPNQFMSHDQINLPGDVMHVPYLFELTSIMLTLNPMTLFYWLLSDPPLKKMRYSVESQVKSIPSNAKPASRAPSQANSVKPGTNRYSSTTPALTSASSHPASSVLTCAITITNTQVPIKIKQDLDAIYTYNGALLDHKETTGLECDVACASPIKGKRHLNSEVSTLFITI